MTMAPATAADALDRRVAQAEATLALPNASASAGLAAASHFANHLRTGRPWTTPGSAIAPDTADALARTLAAWMMDESFAEPPLPPVVRTAYAACRATLADAGGTPAPAGERWSASRSAAGSISGISPSSPMYEYVSSALRAQVHAYRFAALEVMSSSMEHLPLDPVSAVPLRLTAAHCAPLVAFAHQSTMAIVDDPQLS